jgi:hypothetical protein
MSNGGQQLESRTAKSDTIEVTRHPLGGLHIYEVTEQDLQTLNQANFSRTIHSTLLGISFTAAVSFIIVLATVSISNPKQYASFVAVLLVSIFVFLYSLIMWIRAEILASKARKQITQKSAN